MNSASVKKARKIAVKKFIFWAIIVMIFISTMISGGIVLIHLMGLVANLYGKYPGILATTVNELFFGTRLLALYAYTVLGVIAIASVFDKLDEKNDKEEAPRLYNVR